MADVRNLMTTFVVSGADLGAEPVDVTESIWADLDEKYGDFKGTRLISCFEFAEPWPTWEMHPAGDEVVCLVAGDVDMTLALPAGDETVRLAEPGAFIVVPKGVWHTAHPHAPTKMIFITPGEGTENREQPERGGD